MENDVQATDQLTSFATPAPAIDAEPRSRHTLSALQGLRGLAALLVVGDHALATLGSRLGNDQHHGFASFLGERGVTIFFIISGFVMVLSHGRDFAMPDASSRFAIRRLGRIAPLYWLATVVYYAKRHQVHDAPGLRALLLSLLFVPHQEPGVIFGRPVYGLGWTLQYEIFFYAFFAVALSLNRRIGLLFLFGSLSIWAGLQQAGVLGTANAASFLGQPIILYFLLGVALGLLRGFLNDRSAYFMRPDFAAASAIALVALVAAMFCKLALGVGIVADIVGICATIVAAAACCLASETSRPTPGKSAAKLCGDATYSIYLTHSFIVGPCGTLVARHWPSIPLPLFVLAMIGMSVPAGLLTYRFVELPILRAWLRLTASGRRTA